MFFKFDRFNMSNLTLINFVLHVCGPMRERDLTVVLMLLQAISSILAFFIRYVLAGVFYSTVQ